MMKTMKTTDEARIAEEIVSVLPGGSVARVLSGERETLRYAVRDRELALESIVLSRASLRRLAADPARSAKIAYLQRDLLRNANCRGEFRYPRASHIGALDPRQVFAIAKVC